MPKGIIQNDVFYCDHLTSSDKDHEDIDAFRVKHPEYALGLEQYLKSYALSDEKKGIMRTYLVRSLKTDELVGYYSLKAGLVSLNERDVPDTDRTVFDTVPGIEIADFALNGVYQDSFPQARGLGAIVFRDFIRPLASQVAEIAGAKVLYIFALPYDDLIDNYSRHYHFMRLRRQDEEALHKRLKPAYDESCIFMYQMLC